MKKYLKLSVFIFTTVFAFVIFAGKAEAAQPTVINGGGYTLGPDELGAFLDAPNPNSNQTTLVSANWMYNTKPGHFLTAVISFRGGSGVTITPPLGLGWTLAVRSDNDNPNSSGLPISTAIYYIKSAATQLAPIINYIDIPNGNVHQYAPPSQQTPAYSTWTLSAPNIEATLSLSEWTGIDTNNPLDVSGSDISSLNNSANDIALGRSGLTDPVRYTNEIVVGSIAVANRGNSSDPDNQPAVDVSIYPTGYLNPGNNFSHGLAAISHKDATTPNPTDTTPDLTKGVANIGFGNVNPIPVGTKVGVKIPITSGFFTIPGEATSPGFVWLPGEDQTQPRRHPILVNPVAWAGAVATFKSTTSVAPNGGSIGGKNTFKRDLAVGSKGTDVTALQNYLIKNGFLKKSAIKSGTFGSTTKTAVAKWQSKNKLSPANGYFGAKSRSKLGGW